MKARSRDNTEDAGPDGASPRRRRGRKPALNEADIAGLRAQVTADPATPLVELVRLMAERTGKKVSATTITKGLKSVGFMRAKPRRPPSRPTAQSAPRYKPEHRREPTATTYPSSLTDAEWGVLEPVVVAARDPRGRKRQHPLRLMIDAVFYLVRTGSQWRQVPKDFPPWTAVWSLFRRLRDSGTLERMYDVMFALWRQSANRSEQPTAGIIDSQTVKSTEKGGPVGTTPARRSKGARGIWLRT